MLPGLREAPPKNDPGLVQEYEESGEEEESSEEDADVGRWASRLGTEACQP